MSAQSFPRTIVGGVSLPRLLIGTNWLLGFTHTSVAADNNVKRLFSTREAIADVLEVFVKAGIDAVMGPLSVQPLMQDGIKTAENRTGRGIIRIDTPVINVDDSTTARHATEVLLDKVKAGGATFCLPHHQSVEQLVNKNKRQIVRLPDYLSMIRQRGMIPGLSAHMPEIIIFSDEQNYDVETYIQIFNCIGYLMQIEVEYIHKVIWAAKKPVMTIKPLAAGRVTPFIGLTFVWNSIREQDMVTVGCMTPEEAAEDIEYSLAAIEHRMHHVEGRGSPAHSVIMK
jgi:hypothetical protein